MHDTTSTQTGQTTDTRTPIGQHDPTSTAILNRITRRQQAAQQVPVAAFQSSV